MKQQIVEKLFNNQELETEEIIWLTRNLKEEGETEGIKPSYLPYDHTSKTIPESIGANDKLYEAYKKKAFDIFNKKENPNISNVVEDFEKECVDPLFFRVLLCFSSRYVFSEVLKSKLLGKLKDDLGEDS